MGKNKKAAYSKREEEKANRIVKGLFIGLIVLALVIMVGYAMYLSLIHISEPTRP